MIRRVAIAAAGACSGAATQRSFWQRCPLPQSASDWHCGFGAHLFWRQTKPSRQSESVPHSWQRPSTQILPKPSCDAQSALDLHSPFLGFAGQPASAATPRIVNAKVRTRRM